MIPQIFKRDEILQPTHFKTMANTKQNKYKEKAHQKVHNSHTAKELR